MEGGVSSRHWLRVRGWIFAALAVASIGASLTLFLFNPAESRFYPRCLFHSLTGLDCPGCGGLRAAHQLLHGNIRAAFGYNPLLVCLLPLAGYFLLRGVLMKVSGRQLPQPFENPNWAWVLAGTVILFGVLRNMPQVW